jgi:NADPH-dependent ferric siderophore reductase
MALMLRHRAGLRQELLLSRREAAAMAYWRHLLDDS